MSRLALAGLALASALVGGAASSYVTAAFAQKAPAVVPVVAPLTTAPRFEHYCSSLDTAGLALAGKNGWEMVSAFSSLAGAQVGGTLTLASGSGHGVQVAVTPSIVVTYCFKRPAP
jgi:hypothetical protein